MARPSKTRALDVWMNGERVGRWTVDMGEHRFNYLEEWIQSPRARPLSLSMPLRPSDEPYRTKVVQPFFDNLLPDSDEIRRRMMTRFGVSSTSPFDLLEEAGRDCVGAVQLLRPDALPPDVRLIQGRPITDAGVGQILTRVRTPTMGAQDDDDFRISLAGAQEKTALLWHDNKWWVPEGTTPTTHIFKLPMAASDPFGIDLSASVENEWLCAQVLRHYGVQCAPCEIRAFAGQQVLVVERFDRRLASDGSWLIRLPQEDFCQVTGTPPGMKYEQNGGPGIRKILEILLGSSNALEDRYDFLRTQFLFWLLCAIDGHAKNFSVFIEAGGHFRLTPRYDVLSAYPFLGRKRNQLSPHKVKMAMAVFGANRHYKWKEIRMAHWLDTARQCGLEESARQIFEEVIEKTPQVIEQVRALLPRDFPDTVSEPILEGLRKAANAAKTGLR
ncbi:type II toxin-antitoxin system HipA family toxin [Corallococcus llansteffanensis]|uniref:Type II toxin-antitoxin system HipA family toxin n=1 Tax=Corallococcus llansteffanensis TaxID=2316731 RepID=A0A3A8Q6C1_9BACT|nr:type II toxin-antitoxin system HipA family toxin [Corallococcus llansteffanensis]RKH61735.1 type II toxin-antitoxin system HipA family toxin [Corallococcus llansteffanensis]